MAKAMSSELAAPGSASGDCGPCAQSGGDLAGAVGVQMGLGPGGDRQDRSPERISHEVHARCLLGALDAGGADGGRCWAELVDILEGCSRASRGVLHAELIEPGSASSEVRQARARLRFVAALAEWVNMRDLHRPYALGPPAKD